MKEVHLIYYSPAMSTKKTLRLIGEHTGLTITEHDITMGLSNSLSFSNDDLVIFGVPVYAGRVPALAVESLQKIKGDNTPTALVAVYGNRDYDDALIELKDICEANRFSAIAAGAFVARHSIFPNVAENRPDEDDMKSLAEFGKTVYQFYQARDIRKRKELTVKGNRPYREPSKIPFTPKGDSTCDGCGTCVKMCPTHAIPEKTPKKTDKNLCISCARCITVCPKNSRKFRGLLYNIVRRKFESGYASRKETETFFIK